MYNFYTFFGANGCFFVTAAVSERREDRVFIHTVAFASRLGHQSEKRFARDILYSPCKLFGCVVARLPYFGGS